MANPLLDKEFIEKLSTQSLSVKYAKVMALDLDETPVEEITGRITQGTINIDGESSSRRTCSLSLVADELDIHEYYWGLATKIKIYVGLKNEIDTRYEDVIWFPQGTFIISSFNTSQALNSYTVSLQGKDKMSKLNGEMGGIITALTVDFGSIDYIDDGGNIVNKKMLIKDIINEAVHTFGNEPFHNIVINDLDEAAVELLEYRGLNPVYLLYNETQDIVENISLSPPLAAFDVQEEDEINFYNFFELDTSIDVDKTDYSWYEKENGDKVYASKVLPGQAIGYRITDLTYAGDLILNVGESVTNLLDKIVSMLGDYEYFYNLDGQFVFQRKKTYLSTSWNNLENEDGDIYGDSAAYTSATSYSFDNANLFTSIANTPDFANIKNDYSIWGTKKGTDGSEIPIHMRFAIDKKPVRYTTIKVTNEDIRNYEEYYNDIISAGPQDNITYCSKEYSNPPENAILVDWREVLYQMAIDYNHWNHLENFHSKVAEANPWADDEFEGFINGYTGYEQYYLDISGFWRDIYNPEYSGTYKPIYISKQAFYDELWKEVYFYKQCEENEEFDETKNYYIKTVNDTYSLRKGLDEDTYNKNPNYYYTLTKPALSPVEQSGELLKDITQYYVKNGDKEEYSKISFYTNEKMNKALKNIESTLESIQGNIYEKKEDFTVEERKKTNEEQTEMVLTLSPEWPEVGDLSDFIKSPFEKESVIDSLKSIKDKVNTIVSKGEVDKKEEESLEKDKEQANILNINFKNDDNFIEETIKQIDGDNYLNNPGFIEEMNHLQEEETERLNNLNIKKELEREKNLLEKNNNTLDRVKNNIISLRYYYDKIREYLQWDVNSNNNEEFLLNLEQHWVQGPILDEVKEEYTRVKNKFLDLDLPEVNLDTLNNIAIAVSPETNLSEIKNKGVSSEEKILIGTLGTDYIYRRSDLGLTDDFNFNLEDFNVYYLFGENDGLFVKEEGDKDYQLVEDLDEDLKNDLLASAKRYSDLARELRNMMDEAAKLYSNNTEAYNERKEEIHQYSEKAYNDLEATVSSPINYIRLFWEELKISYLTYLFQDKDLSLTNLLEEMYEMFFKMNGDDEEENNEKRLEYVKNHGIGVATLGSKEFSFSVPEINNSLKEVLKKTADKDTIAYLENGTINLSSDEKKLASSIEATLNRYFAKYDDRKDYIIRYRNNLGDETTVSNLVRITNDETKSRKNEIDNLNEIVIDGYIINGILKKFNQDDLNNDILDIINNLEKDNIIAYNKKEYLEGKEEILEGEKEELEETDYIEQLEDKESLSEDEYLEKVYCTFRFSLIETRDSYISTNAQEPVSYIKDIKINIDKYDNGHGQIKNDIIDNWGKGIKDDEVEKAIKTYNDNIKGYYDNINTLNNEVASYNKKFSLNSYNREEYFKKFKEMNKDIRNELNLVLTSIEDYFKIFTDEDSSKRDNTIFDNLDNLITDNNNRIVEIDNMLNDSSLNNISSEPSAEYENYTKAKINLESLKSKLLKLDSLLDQLVKNYSDYKDLAEARPKFDNIVSNDEEEELYYFKNENDFSYSTQYFTQNNDNPINGGWLPEVFDEPQNLHFWINFLDTGDATLSKFSVKNIGSRPKAENKDEVKAIYFRETPNIILTNSEDKEEAAALYPGFTIISIPSGMEDLFTISSQGKSAKDIVNSWLYNHAYCAENITISSIPLYYLEPNTRITVYDKNSNINGAYILKKISYSLGHNGNMSLNASKSPERLI